MTMLLLAALLAAGPEARQVKLAAPGFTAVKVDPEVADFYAEYLSQKLQESGGIRVTGKRDLQAVLGLERQKALLGCPCP